MSEYRSRTERRQAQQSNQKKGKKKKRGLFKKIILSLVLLFLLAGLAGTITVAKIISDTPPLDMSKLKASGTTKLYDDEGQFATNAFGTNERTHVNLEQIPKLVQDAVISIEDRRFYQHLGVDPIRVGGAVVANITEGFGAEGGSTITQQLIKRAYLSPEKALTRKIKEAYLAVKLEQKKSKDQILELYLNRIYYGQGASGVAAAAQNYFGLGPKELDQLSLAQSAMLAGLPNAPSAYDPVEHPKKAKERRDQVLDAMVDNDKISQKEAEQAKKVSIKEMLEDKPEKQDNTKYAAFVDYVEHQLVEEQGVVSHKDFQSGGLKIYTTLNQTAQQKVEKALSNKQFYQGIEHEKQFESAATVMDTKSGAIRAIGGAHNFTNGDINYAFNKPNNGLTETNQVGSTAKPIMDYGPAIEYLYWPTARMLVDEPYQYNDDKTLKNWDGDYTGKHTIRYHLAKSRNVPAFKTMETVMDEKGKDQVQSFANNLGIGINKVVPSYSIGTFNSTPVKMAGAYASFGNGGVHNEPFAVKKVVFPDGRTIKLDHKDNAAMNSYTAYMITDMLKDVVEWGTGTNANIPGVPLAGKTGSTDFGSTMEDQFSLPSGAVKDEWFVGYTPKLTTAVWSGYSRNTVKEKDSDKTIPLYMADSNVKHLPQTLFKNVMTGLVSQSTSDFEKPNTVVRMGVEKGTMKRPSDGTPENQIDYELFVKGHNIPNDVSNKFKQLESVKNLKASYKQEEKTAEVTWDHDTSSDGKIEFIVKQKIDGKYQPLGTTTDQTMTVDNLKPGTHTFSVTAKLINESDESQNRMSDPQTVQVKVPKQGIPDIPPEQKNPKDNDGPGKPNNPGNGPSDNPGRGNQGEDNGPPGNSGDDETGNEGNNDEDNGNQTDNNDPSTQENDENNDETT
ncbi:transglycosylase domain-containing protein [Tuberibacillus sp. Marseille-P3662]|uniref:transglycosylase domain-containing protein n=1 Tax=Tuberibacillus sp. Marseille-P3662 TaxID=1965358 RepID=UPI001593B688|nr:PBP1A family penicillin-binding protein [Tuberibacillus sp. Marseille-P3662]